MKYTKESRGLAGTTLAEINAKRRENRRLMKTATGEMLRLCEEMEDVLAVMAYRVKHPLPSGLMPS